MKEGAETESGLRRAGGGQVHADGGVHSNGGGGVAVNQAPATTPTAMDDLGVHGNGVGVHGNGGGVEGGPAASPVGVGGAGGLGPLFAASQAQQAAMAAGLFRASMGSALGAAVGALPLPAALMASLQAAAASGVGVLPLAGVGALPHHFFASSMAPSMAPLSAQQSAQLLHQWTKMIADHQHHNADHQHHHKVGRMCHWFINK